MLSTRDPAVLIATAGVPTVVAYRMPFLAVIGRAVDIEGLGAAAGTIVVGSAASASCFGSVAESISLEVTSC